MAQKSSVDKKIRASMKRGQRDSNSEARNALVEEYRSYVSSIVARLIRTMNLPSTLRDDFLSAGMLGLVEAADRFDPSKGYEFKTFAFLRIRGAIIDQIRAGCEFSGHAYRTFKAVEAAHELQTAQFEGADEPRPSIPAQRLGHALEYLSKSAMAFKLLGATSPAVLGEAVCTEHPEEVVSKKQESEKIRALVATLPEKERTIIEQYYFHDRKLTEVADNYAGLSKSWVSRLHDRALSILRDRLMDEYLAE